MIKQQPHTNHDIGTAVTTAAALKQGRFLLTISLILSFLALAQIALPVFYYGASIKGPIYPQCLVLIFGIIEFWFSLRVSFDAELFDAIATSKIKLSNLDETMIRFGFIKREKTERGMLERSRGALRLLKIQAWCLVCQIAAFVTALSIS